MRRTGVGIVGCGNISGIYFEAGKTFENLEIVACADLMPERAAEKAKQYGVPRACTVEELVSDPAVEIVVNLTVPKAHASVALAAIQAGKHVHSEKPLATSRSEGLEVMRAAAEAGVRVGCAPDTFMGGGHQTCRKLIDDGAIGTVVGATAFMLCHGHETWHPSPEFYYEVGGGPMMDMGPYYLTALVNMMGPIRRVTGSARVTFPERTITSQPKNGKVITVETPTHIAGVMDFASGAIGTILTTFDVWHSTLPRIEVYGTEGSLLVPDPNGFGGEVRIRRAGDADWTPVALTHGYDGNSRGIAVADMASAITSGRPHRASGELAFHVLDAMEGYLDASASGSHLSLTTTCSQPAALPVGLPHGSID